MNNCRITHLFIRHIYSVARFITDTKRSCQFMLEHVADVTLEMLAVGEGSVTSACACVAVIYSVCSVACVCVSKLSLTYHVPSSILTYLASVNSPGSAHAFRINCVAASAYSFSDMFIWRGCLETGPGH